MSSMFPHPHYGSPQQVFAHPGYTPLDVPQHLTPPQAQPHQASYGQRPFTGQPNWQGGPPPWLAALIAAHQNAQAQMMPQAPQVGVIPPALPPGLVGNTHVPFLQTGGSGYPGNYQGFVNGGFGQPMPPTADGRVGV